jgi:F-type H+-transporting ATPase subunit b
MIFFAFSENSIQLVPDGTLLIHVAAIVVMVFVLNATLFKPVNRLLASREKRGKGRFAEAGEISKRVDDKLAAYESGLRSARAEAYQLLEAEHSAARAEREEALSRIRKELSATTLEQKKEVERQAAEARQMLESNARQFAEEIGGRILGRPI